MSPRKQERPKKKRDFTLLFVLFFMLLFAISVDHAFDALKAAMQAGRGAGNSAGTGPVAGNGGTGGQEGDGGHGGGSLAGAGQGSHGGGKAGLPSSFGSFKGRGSSDNGLAGLEALAAIERQQLERYRQSLAPAPGRSKLNEGWVYVEPMASRPSRYFPELPKPMLSSGVSLSTGPDEAHAGEQTGSNNWGKGTREPEAAAESSWGKGTKQAEASRESSWGKGTRQAEASRESSWGKGTKQPEEPRVNAKAEPTPWLPPIDLSPAPERVDFRAQKARPVESARKERLLEVCGRMVPESQAATASLECAPKPAPEVTRKPASETRGDDGGNDIIMLP